jgi:hypothetical protein
VALVRKLPPDSALAREQGAWSLLDENVAQLVDLVAHQIETEWTDRVTDPDDPEVKQARARAKAAGIRPPRHAPVVPVALRPAGVGEQLMRAYAARMAEFQVPDAAPARGDSAESGDVLDTLAAWSMRMGHFG